MADMYGRATTGAVGRATGTVQQRMTTDGGAFSVPWLFGLSLEGLVFSCQFGAANLEDKDPGTFGAGVVDTTEFDLLITGPTTAGTLSWFPIYWQPVYSAIGTAADTQILLVTGSGAVVGANSITPTLVNANDLSSNTTAMSGVSALGDTGGTGITISRYIYRQGTVALTGVAGSVQLYVPPFTVQTTGYLNVISGASKQVAAYTGGQAATGMYHYAQVEIPTTVL